MYTYVDLSSIVKSNFTWDRTLFFLSSCISILFICRGSTFKHYDLEATLKPYGQIAIFSSANYLFNLWVIYLFI